MPLPLLPLVDPSTTAAAPLSDIHLYSATPRLALAADEGNDVDPHAAEKLDKMSNPEGAHVYSKASCRDDQETHAASIDTSRMTSHYVRMMKQLLEESGAYTASIDTTPSLLRRVTAAAIVTNSFLIYLIIHRSSHEIGAYRHLLLAFALNDIYFPIIHFLTLPVICTYKDAFIMFSHGLLTSRVSTCLFASTFSQTMPLLAHLFIYRLIAIKWPKRLTFYTGSTCFIMVTITLGMESSLWFLNCTFNYAPDAETIDYVQSFLKDEFNGDGQEFIGALYYGVEGNFRLTAFLATMGFNSIMGICMSIIVFCSFSIVVHLRSTVIKWSNKTKKLQQQLFVTLVVQMLIPMVFVYTPCAFIINLAIFGFRVNVFPNLVAASSTIFPLLDAFIIMLGVRSYRQALSTMFKCNSHTIVTVGSSSNPHTSRAAINTGIN